MRKTFTVLALFFVGAIFAQETGTIAGKLLDKESNNQPLPFANVIVGGTAKGASTDFDGLYEITGVPVGTYTLQFSFTGYQTVEIPNVVVEVDKVAVVDATMGATAAALEEVVIKVVTNREREEALLLEQKQAVQIKESIGAEQLSKQGVSDAAAATAKISGVNKVEGSGDIFIRGLGDRYLSTTMNGLPVPSEDVERKNIDLGLFSANIIQNIGVSKTYSSLFYGDQASGNVDIVSKEYSGNGELTISVSGGVNTNVIDGDTWNNFRSTQNTNNTTLGFYSSNLNTETALTQESWNPETSNTPANFGISVTAGEKVEVFGNNLSVFFTGSYSKSHQQRIGEFKEYRANFVNDTIPDAERFISTTNTTGLLNLAYRIGSNTKLKFNSLFINKGEDQLNEFGRGGRAGIFEETPIADNASQFVRDQLFRQTTLFINQLFGDHSITEKDEIDWGIGYNVVNADEPNRIRNELNIYGVNDIRFGNTGGFQQRKSSQEIKDKEINGFLKYNRVMTDSEFYSAKFDIGINYRKKERDFESRFNGLALSRSSVGLSINSFDNLDEGLNFQNVDNGTFIPRDQNDTYEALLEEQAAFLNFDIRIKKLVANLGIRYEEDQLDVPFFNVANFSGSDNFIFNEYSNLLPSMSLKYEVNEKHNIRLAASQTFTLPEFKEIAPFEYVSPTGRVTRGNPNLKPSTNYNYDLKWEFFPTSKELISLTGFYKKIEDPINLAQTRGAAGVFSYFNTAEKADIYGVELEGRINLVEIEDKANLNLNVNVTRMWHSQDLKGEDRDAGQFEEFRYKNKTESGLQGASDWIVNGSLSYSNQKEKEFIATLTGNYASDRIFALGSPDDVANKETLYNEEIIENGFVTMDLILSKQINDKFKVKLTARNLLNPKIKQTQLIAQENQAGIRFDTNNNPVNEVEETILSYKKGSTISLSLNYTF